MGCPYCTSLSALGGAKGSPIGEVKVGASPFLWNDGDLGFGFVTDSRRQTERWGPSLRQTERQGPGLTKYTTGNMDTGVYIGGGHIYTAPEKAMGVGTVLLVGYAYWYWYKYMWKK
jgi:hypothetical protein